MAYQKRGYYKKKETPRTNVPEVEREWSKYQRDIFDDIKDGSGHLVVNAKAGSGKTSTIVQGLKYIPETSGGVAFFAFNKSISEEIKSRVSEDINVQTSHSLGLKTIINTYRGSKIQVDGKGEKINNITSAIVGPEEEKDDLRDSLKKAVSLSKCYLLDERSSTEEIEDVLDKHGVDIGNEDRDTFFANVSLALKYCKQQNKVIDFDDMIWIPGVYNMEPQKFSRVLIDESQDTNKSRLELMLKTCDVGGRIIAVGDPKQAIYNFAGAMEDSMDLIIKRFSAKVLPLSVSYRCAKAIVREAQKIVPDIEYADTAEEGLVKDSDQETMMKNAGPGDFILSRTNAPLVKFALRLLKEGKRVNIQGKDMGKGLIYMIKRSEAKTVNELILWLENWRDSEVHRLTQKRKNFDFITDKFEVMMAFCEYTSDLNVVRDRIKKAFEDVDKGNPGLDKIICSSIHKSKGNERNRVWLCKDTCSTKTQEESNIFYVGITRAKKELHYVNSKD